MTDRATVAQSPDPIAPTATSTRVPRWDLVALLASIVSVVTVSLVRVLTQGFLSVAPDDAAYIGVGRALWGLREPVGQDGSLFTIRSWVYPAMAGGASRLFGGDPFTGPRVLGWTLGTTALVLAVIVAYRLARGPGAIAATLAILATPVIWTSVQSTRIDVALICSTMALLLIVDTPTPRRMLIGGVVAGLTLLIKETSAPLVILPLAYLGIVSRAEWRRLATRYVAAFIVTVAWWFVVVLVSKGEIFPLQGFHQASGRSVPRGFGLNLSAQLLIVLCLAAWLVVAIGRRRDPRARILVLAGLAFVPATVIAWQAGFAIRQFIPIALLSAIALGVAAADVVAAARRRAPRGAVRAVVAVAIVVAVVAVVPIVLTQDRTTIEASTTDLDADIAQWIGAQPGHPTVLTTFRFKAAVWARLEGKATLLPAVFGEPRHPPRLPPLVWVDATGRNYRTMPREQLTKGLRGADYLVLSGPHRFGPRALATWLDEHGKDVGLVPVAQYRPTSGYSWASIYRTGHPRVSSIPTVVTSDAVKRLAKEGGFRPQGPTVIAATRGYLKRYARQHPPDGPNPYEPLRAPPR
ncbi:MAG TPA: hypothetical protein VGN59_08635 [Acidimicrobiia bacterium]